MSMAGTYYIRLFRTGADKHNDILMSLLFLATETNTSITKKLLKTLILILASTHSRFNSNGIFNNGTDDLIDLQILPN